MLPRALPPPALLLAAALLLHACAGAPRRPDSPLPPAPPAGAGAPAEAGPAPAGALPAAAALPAPAPLPVAPAPGAQAASAALEVGAQRVGALAAGARAVAGTLERGRHIARRAARLVGLRSVRRAAPGLPDDCTGLVRAAYTRAGINLVRGGFARGENGVSAIWRLAEREGALHTQEPQPGDLVFFRETYDRNRDGRRNDGMTHVGVVESVDAEGTITFVHRGSKGVSRSRMNLRFPREHRAQPGGPTLNDFLRTASKRSRAYLTGELFAAFASPHVL